MAVEVSGEHCDSLIVQKHHALMMSEDDAFEFYIFPYHGNERFYLRFDLSACPGNLRGKMLEHTKRIAASFKFKTESQGELVLLPEGLLGKKAKGSEIVDHFERALTDYQTCSHSCSASGEGPRCTRWVFLRPHMA